MRKLTIEQALKTPNVKFTVTNEQWLKIKKIIDENWEDVVAICVHSNLECGYWYNCPGWKKHFHDSVIISYEEIQLIEAEEQSMTNKKLENIAPEGYEIDIENSTIRFRKIPVETINKWEDIKYISGYYINDRSENKNAENYDTETKNRNIFKTKEQAESCLAFSMYSQLKEYNDSYEVFCEYLDKFKPMLVMLFGELTDQYIALFKLIKLRDIANGDWIPDWNTTDINKSTILSVNTNFLVGLSYTSPRTLSFKNDQIAQKFIQDNIELLNIAKYLI